MATEEYVEPKVRALGTVIDLTQGKPGIFFDFPGSSEGNKVTPPPGAPGTVS
jgi:hypothetical protein